MQNLKVTNKFIIDFPYYFTNPIVWHENKMKYIHELTLYLNSIDDILLEQIKDEIRTAFADQTKNSCLLFDFFREKFSNCYIIFEYSCTRFSIFNDENNKPSIASLYEMSQNELNKFIVEFNEALWKSNFILNDLSTFFQNIKELVGYQDSVVSSVNPKYVDFWMQLTKIDDKSKQPYLGYDDVLCFIQQAFENKKIEKTFNPKIKSVELRHAAWLFVNKFNFKKDTMTRIMIENFPNHFSNDPTKFKNEYSNIKDCDPEHKKSRIFS